MTEKKKLSKLPSLLGSISGAGAAYLASQTGSTIYIAVREATNFVLGQPLSSIPEILKDYALYTSAAAGIGEIGGYVLAKKIWRALRGR